jgi:hypothetical protein
VNPDIGGVFVPVNVVFAAAALFVAVGRFLHWH